MTATHLGANSAHAFHATRAIAALHKYGFMVPVACILAAMVLMGLLAPMLTVHDPQYLDPMARLQSSSAAHILGTDGVGRDVWSRLVYGARTSLALGILAALISISIGLVLGLLAGYFRAVDAVVMRLVDAMMAMPNILLAVCIVTLVGASLWTVLVAISIPEIPRVVRLVRSVVLVAREEPYVEAARTLGVSNARILRRHLMPITLAPLMVQGSYICAAAILTESILSFLGAGINPSTPTWGNIMADGRTLFRLAPGLIFWPGLCVSLTILSINLLGDAARDRLDPKTAPRSADR